MELPEVRSAQRDFNQKQRVGLTRSARGFGTRDADFLAPLDLHHTPVVHRDFDRSETQPGQQAADLAHHLGSQGGIHIPVQIRAGVLHGLRLVRVWCAHCGEPALFCEIISYSFDMN